MKIIFALTLSVFTLISCKNKETGNLKQEETKEIAKEMAYLSYGDEISLENSLSSAEMEVRYQDLKIGDTVEVNFKTDVNEVCKDKGCWMKLDLPGAEDVMVKFKDYGFFVPKDIDQKEVVVQGKAYITEVSVEEQQHYAKDSGKTEEEIAAIDQPKRTLSFEANGVLIKE
jgi:uncharacterized lipoprotein NlpE involved in copper resistance